MRTLRNADFQEVVLQVEGRPALRFASAYGFRNIQTLMRKIKRGACEYDYVEIMACPSGTALPLTSFLGNERCSKRVYMPYCCLRSGAATTQPLPGGTLPFSEL